jgi:hypothetical protein
MISGSFDFSGTQAGSTNIHPLGGTVLLHHYGLDVRFPDSVGSSMRMADVVAEKSGFLTDLTLCHV